MLACATVVEVFKTDVRYAPQAEKLVAVLLQNFPDCRINFDLEDCDKILRMEGESIDSGAIIKIMEKNGFACEVLE